MSLKHSRPELWVYKANVLKKSKSHKKSQMVAKEFDFRLLASFVFYIDFRKFQNNLNLIMAIWQISEEILAWKKILPLYSALLIKFASDHQER